MQLSFYQFLMKHVNYEANDPISRLANTAHQDREFPKHTHDFDEVSRYLENSSLYTKLIPIFDDVWNQYTYHV